MIEGQQASPAGVAAEAAHPFGAGATLRYAAGSVGAGMIWAFTGAALPFYLAGYGLPNSLIGLLSQPRPPVGGVLQVIIGHWSDRTRTRLGRRRPFFVAGIPLAVATLTALALHPPLPLMLVLLVTMTSALGVAYAPYLALLPDLVPAERQSRVQSVLTIGGTLGQVTSLLLAVLLWSSHEAAVIWLVASGLLAGFAVTFFGVPEPALAAEAAAPAGPPLRQYLSELLSHEAVVKYLIASGLYWLSMGAVLPFLTRFGLLELGIDAPTALGLLVIVIGGAACCTVAAGWLSDRWGKRPTLRLGLSLLAVALLAGSQARTVPQVAVALAAAGTANALCTVALYPLLASLIPPERSGEFTALGYGCWELVQPIGALLAGLAVDATGSLRTAVFLGGLLLAASAVALGRVPTVATAPIEPPTG